jgi:hypothetical protein
MGLDSDTSLVVEWERESLVGGYIQIIGGVGFISRGLRLLGTILSVIESLSEIKRELHRVVKRPYRWLLLCEVGHRHHTN